MAFLSLSFSKRIQQTGLKKEFKKEQKQQQQ